MPTSINLFDRVLKILARNYPERFLELAAPSASVRLTGTLENVELALPEERVDFVHRLDDGGQDKLLHIEFQTEHKSDVPERVFVYSALLTRQFQMPSGAGRGAQADFTGAGSAQAGGPAGLCCDDWGAVLSGHPGEPNTEGTCRLEQRRKNNEDKK